MVTTTNLIEIIRGTNSQIYGGLPIVKDRAEGYAKNDCNLTTEKGVVYFPAASPFVVMCQVCFTIECVITSQSVISRISDL